MFAVCYRFISIAFYAYPHNHKCHEQYTIHSNAVLKGVENPTFFLSQSAGRTPSMFLCTGVIEAAFFPKTNTFLPPKGGDNMAVFRIEKTRDYTVMSIHHLRNAGLSLKSKGLLSMMLSLLEDWNYTTRGLAEICKKGTNSISSALNERTCAKYISHSCLQDSSARLMRGIILTCNSKCSFRRPPVLVRRKPLISAAPLRWS